ncbi:MAG: SCO family protein [Gammaproteobacteria bacterium]|jgi:protein SCO1
MTNRIASIGLVCFAIALAGLMGWLIGRGSAGAGQAGPAAPVLGDAPAYHGLINQLGQPVDSSQFRGKVQVVTFLFPYCTTYCPLIAAHLVGLENLLRAAGEQSQVQIIAFNVDPSGTGPRQMSAFLREYGWNPADLHWQYLTGKPARIRHVVRDGFHIAYQRVADQDTPSSSNGESEQTPQPEVVNPLAEKAHARYDITHNDGLVLVDAQGRIRKIYDQADVVSNRRLLTAIQPLLAASDEH